MTEHTKILLGNVIKKNIIFIFILSNLIVFGQIDSVYKTEYTKAKKLYFEGKYDDALRGINSEIYLFEKNPFYTLDSVFYYKGLIIYGQRPFSYEIESRQKEKLQAIDALEKAIELNPLFKEAYYTKAKILFDYFTISEGVERVLENLDKSIELDSNYIDALYWRSWILHAQRNQRKENLQQSLNDLNRIISLDSTKTHYFYKRANVLWDINSGKKDTEKALKDINKAIDLEGNSCKLLIFRCNILIKLELFPEACQDLEVLKKMNCTFFEPEINPCKE